MTWDPEMDDPVRRPPTPDQPSDYGADRARVLGDEPPPAYRTAAPDPLAPIDPNAPVSGHQPLRDAAPPAQTAEHEWETARTRIHPILRPPGTSGTHVGTATAEILAGQGNKSHTQPLVDDGPAGTVVAFALPSSGFDVVVNGDHVLTWGVEATEVRAAAMANLESWSVAAPWTVEEDGGRHLLSSDTGEGWDASRILLPETVQRIAADLGADGARVLVGIPERHLLVAGSLRPGDDEFAALLGQFIREAAAAADEPIDDRLFELVDGHLVPLEPVAA